MIMQYLLQFILQFTLLHAKCSWISPSCYYSDCPHVPDGSCYEMKRVVSSKWICTDGVAQYNQYRSNDCSGDEMYVYMPPGASSYECDGTGSDCPYAMYKDKYYVTGDIYTKKIIINLCIEQTKTTCKENEYILFTKYNSTDCSDETELYSRTIANISSSNIQSIDCPPFESISDPIDWHLIGSVIGCILGVGCCIAMIVWRHWDHCHRKSPVHAQIIYTNYGDQISAVSKMKSNDIELKSTDKYVQIEAWFKEYVHELDDNDQQLYTRKFVENGFDNFGIIQNMNMDDLKTIGVDKLGHQKTIFEAIKQLNEEKSNMEGTSAAYTVQ